MQILTNLEQQSPIWKAFKARIETRLAKLRIQNDTSMSIGDTEKLRGRIAECKNMLSLEKDPPEIESNDALNY